ncbi:hypothetical protein GCM10007063_00450 [Lentibacillus kapialis]|uniref:Uncharacterized protein n=1 Tax=Lentibacillus kapialis TaxID=340214 RepID=A0A917PK51_9BACI|nr:hypothetical protein GCM10007063_00450 [Lentibacillus kapialis]
MTGCVEEKGINGKHIAPLVYQMDSQNPTRTLTDLPSKLFQEWVSEAVRTFSNLYPAEGK